MHEFNQSLRYDKRMHAADIEGSVAYAKALQKSGLLSAEESSTMVDGLKRVGKEWQDGTVRIINLMRGALDSHLMSSSIPNRTTRTSILRTRDGSPSSSDLWAENSILDGPATIK